MSHFNCWSPRQAIGTVDLPLDGGSRATWASDVRRHRAPVVTWVAGRGNELDNLGTLIQSRR
jgi:hypothetical protein